MIILAADTATKSCSIAICNDHDLLAETTLFRKQTHSRHLLEMIHRTITMAGMDMEDIDGFSITRGPGSFTGLRIGLSCIKGMAYATGKPIVSVSSLEALASQAAIAGCLDYPLTIFPVLDARKKEVYFAGYHQENAKVFQILPENVLPPEELPLHNFNGPCLFIGDGALIYKDILARELMDHAHFVPPQHNYIRGHTIAILSLERFKEGTTDDLSSLAPKYIRKSDPEFKKPSPCAKQCGRRR